MFSKYLFCRNTLWVLILLGGTAVHSFAINITHEYNIELTYGLDVNDDNFSTAMAVPGLTRMSWLISALAHDRASFKVELRPDIFTSRQLADGYQEFDDRASIAYRKKSPLQLLNSYSLGFNLHNDSQVSLGLWNDTWNRTRFLAFALGAFLPDKVAGFRFWLRTLDKEKNLKIYLGSGRGERNERFSGRIQSPSIAKDQWLVALDLELTNVYAGEISLVGGYGSSIEDRGVVTEAFGKARIESNEIMLLPVPVKLFLDSSISAESWKNSKVSSLTQFSLLGGVSLEISKSYFINIEGSWGLSERHQKEENMDGTIKSYGVQVAALSYPAGNFYIKMMTSYEAFNIPMGEWYVPFDNSKSIAKVALQVGLKLM